MKRRRMTNNVQNSSHPATRLRSRPRPRRMIVPSSEQEWLMAEENSPVVYEWDWERWMEETTMQLRLPRPLPSSTVLASSSQAAKNSSSLDNHQGFNMPLLQHLRPQMKNYVNNEETAAATANDTETSTAALDAIDDSNLSTLTRGQHTRYLTLQSGSESWNEGRRKEFRKLSQKVQQEQELYRQCLEQFWERHSDRFKAGLSTPLARYCMAYAKQYQSNYSGPKHFGPCTQVISLQHVSKGAFTSARLHSNNPLSLDSFQSQVIHEEEQPTLGGGKLIVDNDWQHQLVSGGVPVLFEESKLPPLTFVRNDLLALQQLAKEHGASIVTTEETLHTLLQVSGEETTHWMIPTIRRTEDDVVVLDVPIPRPTTPRQCVSKGVTEGLYQTLSSLQQSSASTDTDGKAKCHYVYVLLTLPSLSKSSRSATTKSTFRVLVRCLRRLYVQDDSVAQRDEKTVVPLVIHSQLEYFYSSRGASCWEESTSYDRARWILDKLLSSSSCQTVVAHFDPTTGTRPTTSAASRNSSSASPGDVGIVGGVLAWNKVGIAHALVVPRDNPLHPHVIDPMNHIEALVQVLQHVMDTLAHGEQLLCLTPGATSISIHQLIPLSSSHHNTKAMVQAVKEKEEQSSAATAAAATTVVIDIDKELESADVVYTGAAALRQCARAWQWKVNGEAGGDERRIPFTFPIKEKLPGPVG